MSHESSDDGRVSAGNKQQPGGAQFNSVARQIWDHDRGQEAFPSEPRSWSRALKGLRRLMQWPGINECIIDCNLISDSQKT